MNLFIIGASIGLLLTQPATTATTGPSTVRQAVQAALQGKAEPALFASPKLAQELTALLANKKLVISKMVRHTDSSSGLDQVIIFYVDGPVGALTTVKKFGQKNLRDRWPRFSQNVWLSSNDKIVRLEGLSPMSHPICPPLPQRGVHL